MAKRGDYKDNLKWNVQDLFNSDAKFFESYNALEQELVKYNDFKGHILDNANTLYEFLHFDTEFSKKLERIYIYAHILNDQDTTITNYQSMFGKAHLLYQKYAEATAFVGPEFLKKDLSLVLKYVKENKNLQEYERSLKEIYKYKDHTLSEKEELLLANMAGLFKTPDEVYSLLSDADLRFGKIKNVEGKMEELTEKSYHKFIESQKRSVRKSAFTKLLSTYGNFRNTYASLLMAEVSNNNKLSLVKKYPSAMAASLYRNDIPLDIYNNLIITVKKNIAPLSKFWALKKKALKLKELHLYDANAPMIKKVNHKYTEKEAKELILTALSVLGDTYIKDLTKAFDEGWIDYCPNDGKRNGAYCTVCYSTHPYVLLSFNGTLNNVSTLAHELGHAMHYYFAINNQAYQDYGYSIFVAEVASQVNQILLSKYLINNTSSIEDKKYLIDDLIRDFKATIYRQTMFAEFEKIIYEQEQDGNVLTNEDLNTIYYDLNKIYFGENITIDEEVKYEWARIPHFYMNFYVYQYATAYAAAIKIAMDILNNKPNAVTNYLDFLSLGCTKTPIDSLKVAGVDMTKPEPLEEAFKYFEDLVSELNALYEK